MECITEKGMYKNLNTYMGVEICCPQLSFANPVIRTRNFFFNKRYYHIKMEGWWTEFHNKLEIMLKFIFSENQS